MPHLDPRHDPPSREELEQFAREHAAIAGNTPEAYRLQAADQISRSLQLRIQGLSLMRQIESGEARDSRRNRRKLEAICRQMSETLNEGWVLYQTALTLEAPADPDYLESLLEEWPPNLDEYEPERLAATAATARAATARPHRLPELMKDLIKAPLGNDPMLALQQIQDHLSQNRT